MKNVYLFAVYTLLFSMSDAFSYEKLFEPTPPGEIEIKTIPAVMIAEAETSKEYFEEENGLFRKLFRYIQKNDIAMTTPVEMEKTPGQMRFFIASAEEEKADFEHKGVKVYEREEQLVVSVGLRGAYKQSLYEEGLAKLEDWFTENPEWEKAGKPVGVYWNGPFTLWFLKKSEVYYPIQKQKKEKKQ